MELIRPVKHFSHVDQKETIFRYLKPRDQVLLNYPLYLDVNRKSYPTEMCTPQRSKCNDYLWFFYVALVDHMHNSPLSHSHRQFVVVDPEPVVEKDDALLRHVETDGRQDGQLRWRGGWVHWYQFSLFSAIAEEDVDDVWILAMVTNFFVFLHQYYFCSAITQSVYLQNEKTVKNRHLLPPMTVIYLTSKSQKGSFKDLVKTWPFSITQKYLHFLLFITTLKVKIEKDPSSVNFTYLIFPITSII